MKTSDQGRTLLIERESLELKAYRDSEGYWTIGVGHLLSLDKNADYSSLVWTREKAEQVFAEDLAKYERAVNESIKAMPIEQHQFDALVSFAHNIGVAGVMNSWVVREINKSNSPEGRSKPASTKELSHDRLSHCRRSRRNRQDAPAHSGL
jgi:lysozyme